MSQEVKRVMVPWVEKYRPKNIDEVVYQEEAVNVLKQCLKGDDFPNLLFYGPPGTGKTSTILALAREMFQDQFSSRVLELNASDERGIAVIREKVKRFAQQTVSRSENGNKYPPFKIIVLDEADSMTQSAQACLRRIMEKETKSTRFCIICNYISRIIDPIVSRCSKFRFKPLQQDLVMEKLAKICNSENISLENDVVLTELIKVSGGDLRKAITFLQTAYRLKGDEILTVNDVREVTGYIPENWIDMFVKACQKQSYENVEDVLNSMVGEGFSGAQLLGQLHDWILGENCLLTDEQISELIEALALADYRLLEGADEFLQTFNVASVFIQLLGKK